MPHFVFVWTVNDAIAAVFVGCVVLLFGLIGIAMLVDKAKRRLREWRMDRIKRRCAFPACPCQPGYQCACVLGSKK